MRAARAIWIASVCATLAAGGVFAATVYVQVVDEAGMPIPGATVSAYWLKKPLFASTLKSGSGNYDCDEHGRASIRLNGRVMVALRNARKDGYVFEEYLNQNLYGDILSSKMDTRTNPRRIVLRRPEPVSFLLETDSGGFRRSQGSPIRFGIDLFHKFRQEWKIASYDDFFVSAHYQEEEQRWETVFWTTNANCGLVATVNRRFTAPETGYVSRVEVSQEAFTNKAFTLYLKTRNPTIYAMIPFGLSDLQSRGPVDQVGPTWDFRYKVARINPYGGREMEQDARTMNRIGAELGHEVRTALLKEHRYPPKPDMAARMENNRKRDELEAKMQMLRIEDTRLRREIESITEKMRGEPPEKITQACERQRKWIKESDKVFREYLKELIRLREEAHTLNLPEEGKRE